MQTISTSRQFLRGHSVHYSIRITDYSLLTTHYIMYYLILTQNVSSSLLSTHLYSLLILLTFYICLELATTAHYYYYYYWSNACIHYIIHYLILTNPFSCPGTGACVANSTRRWWRDACGWRYMESSMRSSWTHAAPFGIFLLIPHPF